MHSTLALNVHFRGPVLNVVLTQLPAIGYVRERPVWDILSRNIDSPIKRSDLFIIFPTNDIMLGIFSP
jgi:hypothetical protein